MAQPKCVSCGKALEEGFLQDKKDGASYPGAWIPGAPEKSFWGGVKIGGRPRLAIIALRCTACGLLHLYAPGAAPVA